MQQKVALNYHWLYKPDFTPADKNCTPETEGYEVVDLPHTNKLLPLNYFSETAYQFVSCYKKIQQIPDSWRGQSVFLEFEGVMLSCSVYCNGLLVGGHEGGYTPFTVEITDAVQYGKENVLVVEVDSTEQESIPPFGKVVDYLTYGGIYREVWLYAADAVRLEGLWLDCPDPLAHTKELCCGCEITADAACQGTVQITMLSQEGVKVGRLQQKLSLEAGRKRYMVALDQLKGVALWDVETPILYEVEAILSVGGCESSRKERFGFRQAQFTPEGFFLNGKKKKLIGLNRHQSWPYVGYAMPERIQRKDVELLKEELGCNMVRTSHYPQSRHFLDACDELGLLVMEEIPGWQHIGDEDWQKHSLEDLEAMIRRDYNRPSVILWGVRINESADHHSFYEQTNELAHAMDCGRQTGGVRYIRHSELLEDVYTYNDFTHAGEADVFSPQKMVTGLNKSVPLLVTESNGHMYPTKRFDQELRLTEHAMRHLRVINECLSREDMAGSISWCAFDYNTHACFGSGDKICYHGVYDMFRNPKYAAYAYASQKNPKREPVMEPITLNSRGERDGGGTMPFYILTNCDYVRVYKNGSIVGDFHPMKEEFPHLEHPPIMVFHLMEEELQAGFSGGDLEFLLSFLKKQVCKKTQTDIGSADFTLLSQLAERCNRDVKELIGMLFKSASGWGERENSLLLEGYVGKQPVCKRQIGEGKYGVKIVAEADDSELCIGGDTYDAVRVTVKALDNMGALMLFTQECVEIQLTGPARLLGPSRFPLTGGISSFWIRTTGEPGTVHVEVQGVEHCAQCVVEVKETLPSSGGSGKFGMNSSGKGSMNM